MGKVTIEEADIIEAACGMSEPVYQLKEKGETE